MPTALVYQIDSIGYGNQNTDIDFTGHPSAVPYTATVTYDPSGDVNGDGNMDGDDVDGNYGEDILSDTFLIDLGDGNGEQVATVDFTLDPNAKVHGDILVFTVNGVQYGLNVGGGSSNPPDVWGSSVSTGNQNQGKQLYPDNQGGVCFVRGSMIACVEGNSAVEDLQVGDVVKTVSNGNQVIRWVGRSVRRARAGLSPIRIKAGALGENTPTQDLLVSPAHRMVISGWRAELMFGVNQALVPAKALVNDDSITVAHDLEKFEYFHIMFDNHEIVMSNGAPSESFQANADALNTLDQAARDEILALFPELENSGTHKNSVMTVLSAAEATLLQ